MQGAIRAAKLAPRALNDVRASSIPFAFTYGHSACRLRSYKGSRVLMSWFRRSDGSRILLPGVWGIGFCLGDLTRWVDGFGSKFRGARWMCWLDLGGMSERTRAFLLRRRIDVHNVWRHVFLYNLGRYYCIVDYENRLLLYVLVDCGLWINRRKSGVTYTGLRLRFCC